MIRAHAKTRSASEHFLLYAIIMQRCMLTTTNNELMDAFFTPNAMIGRPRAAALATNSLVATAAAAALRWRVHSALSLRIGWC